MATRAVAIAEGYATCGHMTPRDVGLFQDREPVPETIAAHLFRGIAAGLPGRRLDAAVEVDERLRADAPLVLHVKRGLRSVAPSYMAETGSMQPGSSLAGLLTRLLTAWTVISSAG